MIREFIFRRKNGTGKSTLLKALKGSIRTDIQFCVNQFPQAFDRITYVSSDLIFKYRLTVLEQLLLLNDDPNRIEQVIQDFNLKPLLSKKDDVYPVEKKPVLRSFWGS